MTPIFITRLSDDSGDSITGGCATAGSCAAARRQRAPARAAAPSSGRCPARRISTTDDRPSTDFDRMVVETGHAVERVLERHGDQRFDLARRQARRFGLDLDERRRELGKHVERRRAQRPPRGDGHDHGQRDDDVAVPQRDRDQPGEHGYFPAPNSVPKSSAAPTVTTFVPSAETARDDGAVAGAARDLDATADKRAGPLILVHPRRAVNVVEDRRVGNDEAGFGRDRAGLAR